MAAYSVTAPLVIIQMEDGSYQHLYEGTPVPDGVNTDHLDLLVADGSVTSDESSTSKRRGQKTDGE